MAGTTEGGRKAAARNRQLYGADFYKLIGHKGGIVSAGGGFAHDFVSTDGLTGRERAVLAGRKGGKNSRRRKSV